MAELPPPTSQKPHKKHKKSKDVAIDTPSSDKAERKTKKRKLSAETDDTASNVPAMATTTTKRRRRTLGTAAVSTPYVLTTISRYLPISPAYSATPHIGIQRDHLDPLVLKYDSTLAGVVLLHRDLQFHSSAAEICGESPFAFAWCRVEVLLFRPAVGMLLEGYVNDVSPSHVGMLYGNVFSVAVKAGGIPGGWQWSPNVNAHVGRKGADEGEGGVVVDSVMGRWIDADGEEVAGLQRFVVTAVKAEGGLLSLEGSFKDEDLPEEEEEEEEGHETAEKETVGRETTEIHGRVLSDDEDDARRRRKEKKEKKKRKRAE
ncbi:hypothetical protein DRE_05148 [Drechslerella stenobrocha 248]|uniref:DNA-directed RNA polymerase subunit n=1 Tax=Drechslerella stenobrocha 248 TaxID=1043628 RepID=W7HNZ1_9PEZI|nr:hypothetical protein DRE_05148 [Drechslerella stenobrocha 248]